MASRAPGNASTIHDIARRLNVSSTTVWRALNNRPRISTETRRRILAEVKRLGYQPSLVAQTLSWGRTQTIGVVVPTISNSVHASLVRAIEQAAFDHDFSITLCDTDFNFEREQRHLDLLIRRRVEGVLLVPYAAAPTDDEAHLNQLLKAGIAVVCLQQKLPSALVSQVLPDNFSAARDMTRHLIKVGHRRIAFVHGGLSPWQVSMNERLAGYRAALDEAGIRPNSNWIVEAGTFEAMLADASGELYVERVTRMLTGDHRPTAVFASVDVLAIKLMSLARSLGLCVPQDLAIAGFDDIQMAGYTDPPLTTVRHPAAEVGRKAAELLFDQIAAGGVAGDPVLERVPCELVIRCSCGTSPFK
jgi:DNA-binding LacI/PurR family transcriptional regulator